MSIQYTKTKVNGSFVRPKNYTFPNGLSISGTGVSTVDYLVIAGGEIGRAHV